MQTRDKGRIFARSDANRAIGATRIFRPGRFSPEAKFAVVEIFQLQRQIRTREPISVESLATSLPTESWLPVRCFYPAAIKRSGEFISAAG